VTVRHHPDSTVAAMLLVGWLASRLGWELGRSKIVPQEDGNGVLTGIARSRQRAGPSGAEGRSSGGVQVDPAPGGDSDPALGGDGIALRLQVAPDQVVRGLAGVELGGETGLRLRLDRGPGGLRADRRDRAGTERSWTVLGASRGEGGILGEGIRQALLRDPTYRPALESAHALLP
jgi:hypothetical protein